LVDDWSVGDVGVVVFWYHQYNFSLAGVKLWKCVFGLEMMMMMMIWDVVRSTGISIGSVDDVPGVPPSERQDECW
jgi:hypothetical protein